MKTDDGQPAMKCCLKMLAILCLHSPGPVCVSLRRLPFADLVRDEDGCFDIRRAERSTGENCPDPRRTEIPLRVETVAGQSTLQTR